ncbi:MAG: flagellar basal body P-ring formation chaperone FlgA [Porticoccaceae bacterium]|nr:flagellar basal body P-ring formation protein FlgA [Pseudomonadales bacterium]MCP5173005.1 flagellar basal body P-ring formation protein FlgA [Pseudomonadales bacterium]
MLKSSSNDFTGKKMTYFWRLSKLSLLFATLASGPGFADDDPQHSLIAIVDVAIHATKTHAQQMGYKNVAVETRPLDNRLQLPLCSEPLTTSLPGSGSALGAISVGVRCAGLKPWTIYVRTEVSALESIPVLARPLSRHSIISKDDLKLITRPLQSSKKNTLVDTDEIIGQELTRSLPAGSELRPVHLRAPKIIKRGQQVTVKMNLSSLEVRSQGKALNDAAAGEAVTVTNLNSGKKVRGIALPDGSVIVQ